jgi:hypothetical protein
MHDWTDGTKKLGPKMALRGFGGEVVSALAFHLYKAAGSNLFLNATPVLM